MLDPDISTADARRLLSVPSFDADGPNGWSRRRFLQAVGLGVGAGLAVGTLGQELLGTDLPEAWAGAPIGPTDGILITLFLYGGNDGLNTVVPFTDGLYYSQRANIAIPAAQVLPINATHGLNPNLAYLKKLYDQGNMAVVHGVGYNNPDRSHFNSMAIWMAGKYGSVVPTTGWLGRWLDGQPAQLADTMAATIDTSVPQHLVGDTRRALGVPPWGGLFGSGTSAQDQRLYTGMRAMAATSGGRGPWHDAFASTMKSTVDIAGQLSPVFNPSIDASELTKKMTMAARLINCNLGFRVIDLGRGGLDNHSNEPGDHTEVMVDLNESLQAFYDTLNPLYKSRVTILTLSEFGRTPYSNDTLGTDHGTTSNLFVIGDHVRGGTYGTPSPLNVSQWANLAVSVDFRTVYGNVLDNWLGGGGSTILGGSYPNMNLFESGPGGPPEAPADPPIYVPTPPGGFTPMSPARLFDTRTGQGGRSTPLGAAETWTFPVAGAYGVPAEATAVAINVTATGATAATYITAWQNGSVKPSTSNLNVVPGVTVPNLVIGRIGASGAVNFYNNAGKVDLIGDIVGYYREGVDVGMTGITPARLLDTRNGTGGRTGPLLGGEKVDLRVAGVKGVPTDATAVVLNVTATETWGNSFLTVWPQGEARPNSSSLNMTMGQTVPNMVIARVANQRVSIYNDTGSVHVLVDVLGYFKAGTSGKFVAVGPNRLLDTRNGTGAAQAKLGQTVLSLPVRGKAGVPTSNVAAVMLNVTAVTPTLDTFVTVFPGGSTQPVTSNLNVLKGQVVPNMVVCRLSNDGTVDIANNAGAIDLVADVVGYFTL